MSFGRLRGVPRRTLSRNVSPAIFPRGVRSSPESCELRLRPLVPSPSRPLHRRNRTVPGPAGPPLVGFLLPRTQLRRVPLLRRLASLRSQARDEDRQTLVGAVLRVLAPLDGSGWLAARSRSFGPRRSPWPPTLRGLLSCRSRPWSAPPELSLPGEPYPLSRATCFLAGSLPTAAGAAPAGDSRPLSRFAPALCPRARPKADPGRTSRDDVSSRSLVRSPRRTRRRAARTVLFPPTLGSPVNGRHARFEALLPPGVRSATTPSPGQAEAARRCSPGVLALQSSLHHGSGFGVSCRLAWGALAPDHARLQAPSRRGCTSATRTPTLGLASPRSVDTQGL